MQLSTSCRHRGFLAVANEFSMASLYPRLIRTEPSSIRLSATGSVLRLKRYPIPTDCLAEAFVFPYVCLAVWGSDDDCDHFLTATIDAALQPRNASAVDTIQYTHGFSNPLRRDIIALQVPLTPNSQVTSLSKVSTIM